MKDNDNIFKGSCFALIAFFCMAVFGVLTKIACASGDYIWVSFITYVVASFGTGICLIPQGKSALKSNHYRLLSARAIIGTIASFLYMLSLNYIPIVNATLLFNTAPIFIPILMVCILKKKISKNIWIAVLTGFIGIIAIIKPNANIFTDPGNIIALLSGLALGIAYLIMKRLTFTESGLKIIFYYFSIGTLMQLPLLGFTTLPNTIATIFYASICGIVLMCAQLGLVKAYSYATASQVGVFQYSSVVFVAIFQWLLWSMRPDILDYLGFILVSTAGIYIIISDINADK